MVEQRKISLRNGEQVIDVGDVDRLDYTTDEPQAVYPRGTVEVVRFVAPCVRDQRRTYTLTGDAHDRPTSDPSALLGPNYAAMVSADEYDAGLVGPDVAICWECYNNSGSDVHAEAVALAAKRWIPKPPMIVVGGREFKIDPPEPFWETERGGDGYDRMEAAEKHKWAAVSVWGRHGWDFLEWPYYIGYVRNTAEGFEFATNCEGDVDWYRFPTNEARIEHMDRLAFWHWQNKGESWVKYAHPDRIPARLRGPFSWERSENEKNWDD